MTDGAGWPRNAISYPRDCCPPYQRTTVKVVPPQTGPTTCWSQRRRDGASEVDEGPIRKVKQRNNRVHHLERWGYDNVLRIEVRPDGTITEWRHWAEPDLIG